MPDGTTIMITGETDVDPIKSWYESPPDVKEIPSLNYPV